VRIGAYRFSPKVYNELRSAFEAGEKERLNTLWEDAEGFAVDDLAT
jgi:hypothetical protein